MMHGRTSAIGLGCLVLSVLAIAMPSAGQQMGDTAFRPQVDRPAYSGDAPMIQLDAAHGSAQTIEGRYAGFAALSRADGYRIRAGEMKLDQPDAFEGVDVLVISNAVAPADGSSPHAFTEAEIAALDAGVRAGGSLLLAVDHAPYGDANETLGRAFGVRMGKGYAFRVQDDGGTTTQLEFASADGTLGDHPVTRGRDAAEVIRRVQSFTGQSLAGPSGATVLMALRSDDHEAANVRVLRQVNERLDADPSRHAEVLAELARPALPAQGLAFEHGLGRVVVLGEAGMLTAQRIRFPPETGEEDVVFGLQTTGHDDQQFALNMLHWLSRLEGMP